jgi:hypothetical protein
MTRNWMPILVAMLAAEILTGSTDGPAAPRIGQDQSGVHMNRHVDAHVPARDGERTTDAGQDSTRRPSAQDPFRGVIQTPPSDLPPALQPRRDRRY